MAEVTAAGWAMEITLNAARTAKPSPFPSIDTQIRSSTRLF